MSNLDTTGSETEQIALKKDKFESLGFAYCKIATPSLLCGRFTLPVAAVLSAVFFCVAYARGTRETRCMLKYPLAVAIFWTIIASLWIGIEVSPNIVPGCLHWMHR